MPDFNPPEGSDYAHDRHPLTSLAPTGNRSELQLNPGIKLFVRLASTSKPLTRWEQEEPGETSISYGSENAKMPLPAGMTIICFPPASKLIGLEDMVPPTLMRHFSLPVS